MKQILLIAACVTLWIFAGCEPGLPSFPDRDIEGMRPIYADSADFLITKNEARTPQKAGKIYVYGNVLLINEVNEGIHVVDNSDISNPQNLFFIQIPGNTDIAVKDGLIYANNHTDMVVLEISENTFQEVGRVQNLFFEEEENRYPRQHDIYFECIDESKGRVIGWKKEIISSPQCYKN